MVRSPFRFKLHYGQIYKFTNLNCIVAWTDHVWVCGTLLLNCYYVFEFAISECNWALAQHSHRIQCRFHEKSWNMRHLCRHRRMNNNNNNLLIPTYYIKHIRYIHISQKYFHNRQRSLLLLLFILCLDDDRLHLVVVLINWNNWVWAQNCRMEQRRFWDFWNSMPA